eukprot:1158529-Pelagomonas_calceolata.AAC.5
MYERSKDSGIFKHGALVADARNGCILVALASLKAVCDACIARQCAMPATSACLSPLPARRQHVPSSLGIEQRNERQQMVEC